jgi:hypothetical protein
LTHAISEGTELRGIVPEHASALMNCCNGSLIEQSVALGVTNRLHKRGRETDSANQHHLATDFMVPAPPPPPAALRITLPYVMPLAERLICPPFQLSISVTHQVPKSAVGARPARGGFDTYVT